MTHSKKLEQVLDFLINEETEKATDLLHDIVVEKARQIYEDLLDGEEVMEVDSEESFGGDVGDEFVDDIEAASDDIDADEAFNDADVSMDSEGEEDLEDRIGDLEAQLADLEAKFAELTDDEMADDEVEFDDFGDAEGSDDSEAEDENVEDDEELTEATKLSNDVSIDMSKEGQLVGTGDKSKTGSLNTKSPIAKKPSPSLADAKAVKFSNSGKDGNQKPLSADKSGDFGAKHNMNADLKKGPAVDMKKEGKPVGTGKGAPKGAVSAKPVLPKK